MNSNSSDVQKIQEQPSWVTVMTVMAYHTKVFLLMDAVPQIETSEQPTITNFYSAICVRLCGANVRVYCGLHGNTRWHVAHTVTNRLLLLHWNGLKTLRAHFTHILLNSTSFLRWKSFWDIQFPVVAFVVRAVVLSVKVNNNQYLANGILRLSDICERT